jgi:hypothetical protein
MTFSLQVGPDQQVFELGADTDGVVPLRKGRRK